MKYVVIKIKVLEIDRFKEFLLLRRRYNELEKYRLSNVIIKYSMYIFCLFIFSWGFIIDFLFLG